MTFEDVGVMAMQDDCLGKLVPVNRHRVCYSPVRVEY